jgi:hypothetical protein
MQSDPSNSISESAADGFNPWKEMLDETVVTGEKGNVSLSSDQEHLGRKMILKNRFGSVAADIGNTQVAVRSSCADVISPLQELLAGPAVTCRSVSASVISNQVQPEKKRPFLTDLLNEPVGNRKPQDRGISLMLNQDRSYTKIPLQELLCEPVETSQSKRSVSLLSNQGQPKRKSPLNDLPDEPEISPLSDQLDEKDNTTNMDNVPIDCDIPGVIFTSESPVAQKSSEKQSSVNSKDSTNLMKSQKTSSNLTSVKESEAMKMKYGRAIQQCIYCKFCDVGFWDTSTFAAHLVTCSEMRSGVAGKQILGMMIKDGVL